MKKALQRAVALNSEARAFSNGGEKIRPLRVAILAYAYGLELHGIGKYSWHLAHELSKLGVHVDVFTTNLHLKTIGVPLFYVKNAFLNLKKYDIVHSDGAGGIFLYHPRMIETYHHDYRQPSDVNSLVLYGIEALQCRRIKHIIVPSFATKNSLLNHGFKEEKITVIHHGIDHETFKHCEASGRIIRKKYGLKRLFTVISVGRLVKHKRHIDIIEALSKIPETAFILVGAGPEEERIVAMAKEKNVKLWHFKNISEELLAGLYNAADVYVHASVLEGFGLTVIEAMACALPVICYNAGDFKNIVRGAGIVLKPRDVEAMVHAIEFLKEKNGEQKALSQAALKKSKVFTWKKTAEEHLKVYRKVCHIT
jgi:glycosyltransferase involved in cell wall biosynthesis